MLLIPHRSDAADEDALLGGCRKILAIVREADGPVQVRAVGERLGMDALARGKFGAAAGEDDQARRLRLTVQASRRLHRSHPPTSSTSIPNPARTRPAISNFTMHSAQSP
ncbi:hypothetical protein [Streptomyces cyaneofuscatus]|uniref:hypothetical protein n=1 Tax=Streptomyces TaxID=1883 RepID=UPI003638967C|nr:hypothetical protein OH733_33515 [Streptomyces griseus]WTD66012.1 hypothetical protein OH763_03480 [Streptomyces griseus]